VNVALANHSRQHLARDGISHDVVARSVPCRLLWTTDTVKVNGKELALTKTY
jgi:hypothetical protein